MDRGDAAVTIQRAWRAAPRDPFMLLEWLQHQRLYQRAVNHNLKLWVITTWYATIASYGYHDTVTDPDYAAAMADEADAAFAGDDMLWVDAWR